MGTIDIQQFRGQASEVAGILRLLSNEDRLMLLCQLSMGECSVGELEQLTAIRQPTLSQQLGVLRQDGLVETRRVSRQIFYRLEEPRILALLQTLHGLYCTEPVDFCSRDLDSRAPPPGSVEQVLPPRS